MPFARHISYGADPTTEISVVWQVPAVVGNPYIRIGRSPLDLGEKIKAQLSVLSTPFTDVSAVDSVPLIHAATVEQYYIQARVEQSGAG